VQDLPRISAVSSSDVSGSAAANAIDDSLSTRWESEHDSTAGTNWIYVDLGVNMYVTEVTLDWATNSAKNYQIEIAADGSCPGNGYGCLETDAPWTTLHSSEVLTTNPDHRIEIIPVAGVGRYVRMYTSWAMTAYGYSLYDFGVKGTTGTECDHCPNPLLPRIAAVASTDNGTNVAANAVDGSTTTRWESVHGVDPQWIYVDLGENRHLDGVLLDWETASASQFTIQVAPDGTCAGTGPGCLATDAPWTIVSSSLSVRSATNHAKNHIGLDTSGRYVRMHGTSRNTAYGYSLWNFSVMGTKPGCSSLPCGRCETLEGEECVLKPPGSTCRATGSGCDVAETCDGASPDCPADEVLPAGTLCRPLREICDVAESCNGFSGSCPGDGSLKPIAVAASSELSGHTADRAIDPVGAYSQWESIHGPSADPSWFYVDLGETFHVTRLSILWSETAPAKKYQVQVAPDGTCLGSAAGCLRTNDPWTTVYTSPTYNSGDNLNGGAYITGTGRYVRIYATQQMNGGGYAIRDLNVYGSSPVCGPGGLCSDDSDCGDCGNCEANGACSIASEGSLCSQDEDPCKQTTCDGVYNLCFYEPERFTKLAAKASTELGGNVAANVLDNIVNSTRWESAHGSDPQWIYVDIGSDVRIQDVTLHWIESAAQSYEIQVAPDGTCSGSSAGCLGTDHPWITAASINNSESGGIRIDRVEADQIGRYVRIYGTSRTTENGYSLGHVVVSGNANPGCGDL
jgi:beta-glucosidase